MKLDRAVIASIVALSSAYLGQPGLPTDASNELVFHFPNINGIGTLETKDQATDSGNLNRIVSHKRKLASAIGVVKLNVSPQCLVFLTPGSALIKQPELIDQISPDNILGFSFSFTSTDDSEDEIADRIVLRLSHLKNLRWLKLSRCDVSDVGIKGLHGLPHLNYLDLSYTIISTKATTVLAKLDGLEDLNLNNTNLSSADFTEIAKLPRLKSIYLRTTKINNKQVKTLATCKSITNLDVSNNPGITDAIICDLTAMANLKSVNLANTSITLGELSKLSCLKKIIVSSRDLKGQSLKDMKKKLPQLELDEESQNALNKSSPNAEEMRLFAPTRY